MNISIYSNDSLSTNQNMEEKFEMKGSMFSPNKLEISAHKEMMVERWDKRKAAIVPAIKLIDFDKSALSGLEINLIEEPKDYTIVNCIKNVSKYIDNLDIDNIGSSISWEFHFPSFCNGSFIGKSDVTGLEYHIISTILQDLETKSYYYFDLIGYYDCSKVSTPYSNFHPIPDNVFIVWSDRSNFHLIPDNYSGDFDNVFLVWSDISSLFFRPSCDIDLYLVKSKEAIRDHKEIILEHLGEKAAKLSVIKLIDFDKSVLASMKHNRLFTPEPYASEKCNDNISKYVDQLDVDDIQSSLTCEFHWPSLCNSGFEATFGSGSVNGILQGTISVLSDLKGESYYYLDLICYKKTPSYNKNENYSLKNFEFIDDDYSGDFDNIFLILGYINHVFDI